MNVWVAVITAIGRIFGVVGSVKIMYKIWKLKQEAANMDTKGILMSKTVWGIIIMVAAQIAKRYGISIDEAGITDDILSAVGTILAIVGRFTATTQLTVTGAPK